MEYDNYKNEIELYIIFKKIVRFLYASYNRGQSCRLFFFFVC